MKQEKEKRDRLRDAVTLAADLHQVHANESFQLLLNKLEQNWVDDLIQCTPAQDEERRWLACNIQTLRYIRERIQSVVAEGERAQRNLAEFQ